MALSFTMANKNISPVPPYYAYDSLWAFADIYILAYPLDMLRRYYDFRLDILFSKIFYARSILDDSSVLFFVVCSSIVMNLSMIITLVARRGATAQSLTLPSISVSDLEVLEVLNERRL